VGKARFGYVRNARGRGLPFSDLRVSESPEGLEGEGAYRNHSGEEVDLVLEEPGRRVVGVEVKARGSLRPEDLRGLKSLAQALGPRFHRGVVLYLGRETVPFAKDLPRGGGPRGGPRGPSGWAWPGTGETRPIPIRASVEIPPRQRGRPPVRGSGGDRFPGDYRLRRRTRLDGLLLGRGEAVGLKRAGTANPKRDALEALGFGLHGFAQRNGLRPRLLLVTPHRALPHSLAPVGSPAYRRTGEALRRAVEALRQGAPVAGRRCGGCPLRHGCPARVV
jgi:hypothetical protein